MSKGFFFTLLLLPAWFALFSQDTSKVYFDKSGRVCSPEMSYYFRQKTDSAGLFRCYYCQNNSPYFRGNISSASPNDENSNVYQGTCYWYYKNGNPKYIRSFNELGEETGTSKFFYESGKIWKEIEFFKGRPKTSAFIEYDEDGSRSRIFEEHFNNNYNEWDLYMSDKSSARIEAGQLSLISTSREGTSRFINHPFESDEYTIETELLFKNIKDEDRVGLIYGFKDWNNYHYFVVSKKNVFIGSFYEGVKAQEIEGMYCSALNPLTSNNLKIISNGEKMYFSVNGDVQFKSDSKRLFGNNFGLVISGNSQLLVEKLILKELNAGSQAVKTSPSDEGVKVTGSGVIFNSEGYILTNHHVIENSGRYVIEVNNNAGKVSYDAELVIVDKDNDIAILKIKDPDFKPLSLQYAFKENGHVDVGAPVFTIGYPHALSGMGKEAKFTDGRVSSKTGYNGNLNSFQTSIPVQPGNSGGPVFNSDGQLIGLVNATFKEADNVSYVIRLNYIKNLIELMPEKTDYPAGNALQSLSLEEKIKILTGYVVLIKVK